ncbi:MAG: uncharacterized protein A8A55_2669 [Amphiamblys sp. WSBS2006]|nr:MAG: uncharacterized protein A8A55_2669 [Amphiamblys sp. WSBS2006]
MADVLGILHSAGNEKQRAEKTSQKEDPGHRKSSPGSHSKSSLEILLNSPTGDGCDEDGEGATERERSVWNKQPPANTKQEPGDASFVHVSEDIFQNTSCS